MIRAMPERKLFSADVLVFIVNKVIIALLMLKATKLQRYRLTELRAQFLFGNFV